VKREKTGLLEVIDENHGSEELIEMTDGGWTVLGSQ
jgi:hypothetical protein